MFQRWWANQTAKRKLRIKIWAVVMSALSALLLALGYWVAVVQGLLAVAALIAFGEFLLARERRKSN